MIYSPNGMGNVGIGFAIPVDTVRRVVNQIIRYGKVVRPTLGIHVVDDRIVRNISMQIRKRLNGVLIAEVLPNSPAERAGLKATFQRSDGSLVLGDLITHVDDQPVRHVEDLLSAIEEKREDDIVRLRLERGVTSTSSFTKTETISVRLMARDKLRNSSIGKPSNTRLTPTSSVWQ
jgi:S1-C subfamily serine protease